MKLTFSTKIELIGVNPYVIPPENIVKEIFKQAGREKGAIPVKGTIQGKDFLQTLVRYQGAWRLYINGLMRKAARVDVGDTVEVAIFYDPSSRQVPMHPDLQKALQKNKKAKVMFESYSPSRQKEINRYLSFIKTKETLAKNIDRIVRYLAGEKVEYFVLLKNKNER